MTGTELKDYARAKWAPVLAFMGGGTVLLTFLAMVSGAWSQAGLPIPASRTFVKEEIAAHVREHSAQLQPIKEKIDALTSAVKQLTATTRESKESSLRIERLGLEARLREVQRLDPTATANERYLIEKRLGEIDAELRVMGGAWRERPPF